VKIVKPNVVPPFRVHKATGQGYVNLDGRRVYLGRADTPEAKQRYARALAEWLSGGEQPLDKPTDISIVELAARYWRVIERPVSGQDRQGQAVGSGMALQDFPRLAGGVVRRPGRLRLRAAEVSNWALRHFR